MTALIFAGSGIFLTWMMYNPSGRYFGTTTKLNRIKPIKLYSNILKDRYYFDTLFLTMASGIDSGIAEGVNRLDIFIDSIVDGIGVKTKDFSGFAKDVDERFVDGFVRFLSNSAFKTGQWFRRRQSGILQEYNQKLLIGILFILILTLMASIPF